MSEAPVHVVVRAGGTLRDALGPRRALALPAGSRVDDLLDALDREANLPDGALRRVAVSVQGAIVAHSHPLADGDEVTLVAPVAGG
jgi:sulfur carrier protein ThiS